MLYRENGATSAKLLDGAIGIFITLWVFFRNRIGRSRYTPFNAYIIFVLDIYDRLLFRDEFWDFDVRWTT